MRSQIVSLCLRRPLARFAAVAALVGTSASAEPWVAAEWKLQGTEASWPGTAAGTEMTAGCIELNGARLKEAPAWGSPRPLGEMQERSQSTEGRLHAFSHIKSATRTSILEQGGTPALVKDGAAALIVSPAGIETVRLQLASAAR